jgi:hypothetical protein
VQGRGLLDLPRGEEREAHEPGEARRFSLPFDEGLLGHRALERRDALHLRLRLFTEQRLALVVPPPLTAQLVEELLPARDGHHAQGQVSGLHGRVDPGRRVQHLLGFPALERRGAET